MAAINSPAWRFSPWRKALDSARLSRFVSILLFVLISCTSVGVALFGSKVNFVIFVLKFRGSFMFNHVLRLVCFLLSVLFSGDLPGVGAIGVDLFSLLLVYVCMVPFGILFSVFPCV